MYATSFNWRVNVRFNPTCFTTDDGQTITAKGWYCTWHINIASELSLKCNDMTLTLFADHSGLSGQNFIFIAPYFTIKTITLMDLGPHNPIWIVSLEPKNCSSFWFLYLESDKTPQNKIQMVNFLRKVQVTFRLPSAFYTITMIVNGWSSSIIVPH